MAIKTYPVDIAAELKTEEDIEGFIKASIEEAKNDTDPKYLIHALETASLRLLPAHNRGAFLLKSNFCAFKGSYAKCHIKLLTKYYIINMIIK